MNIPKYWTIYFPKLLKLWILVHCQTPLSINSLSLSEFHLTISSATLGSLSYKHPKDYI